MNINVSIEDKIATFEVVGQLILGNRRELISKVEEHQPEVETSIIDFSKCGYIDSSGLGALTKLSKKLKEAGKNLQVRGLNPDLRELLKVTKVDTLLRVIEAEG